ncbi:MAG: alginate export family protein [Phycisphaerales bacterium]
MIVRPGLANRHTHLAALAAFAGSVLAFAPTADAQQDQRRLERALRTAQSADDYRLRVDTALTLGERTQIDVGGNYTFTALFLDDSTGNSRRLFQNEVQLYARASIDGVHNAFVRVRFPYRDFSPGDSFDGRGDSWDEPFLDRYVYEFDLARAYAAYDGEAIDNNFNVKIGRQFVDWASSLVLSEVLLSVRPTVTIQNNFTIEGLAGVTARSTVDFDASRSQYDTNTERGYFGLKVGFTAENGSQFYAFGLKMVDYNTDTALRVPAGAVTTANFEYSATYYGVGLSGAWGPSLIYTGELVWEDGHSMSDPTTAAQVRSKVEAYAGRGLITYLFRDENETRAQFEAIYATGDQDRVNTSDTVNGNQAGTRDNAFNGLGFANTGLAFAPTLSNIVSLRLGASTFPFRSDEDFDDVQVGIDGYLFRKATSGGIDEPTNSDTFLGGEIDLFVSYRITSDFAVAARYGVFFPGEAITSTKHARHFFLLSATLSF